MQSKGRARRAGASGLVAAALLAAVVVLGACSDDSITGPQSESCEAGPHFTVLPVAEADLHGVAIFGGVDAPGHTLPTPHGGLFFGQEDVTLRAPGDIAVTGLRRVRYTGPDVPPGVEEDYAIFFQVCAELTGWFGHVVTLASTFPSVSYGDCRTYSVIWATVEACEANNLDIEVSAGAALGTGRGVIDVGMVDQRVTNFYVSPWRFSPVTLRAVCMWEQWDTANRQFLLSILRDNSRPTVVPSGEPRCGTMEVDVAGTAKGVWAEAGVTGPVGGDETRYAALVDYPYRPQAELALSLGPEALGAHVGIVGRRTSGRVNLAFEQVTPDGLIHCYGPDESPFTDGSWLLSMTSSTAIRIERIEHGPGESPCNDDPGTWGFSDRAVAMVR